MRSRNVQFVNKKVKPLTRLYAFFDNVDVTKYCVPKLLEINMISGVFEVGETVTGTINQTNLGLNAVNETPKITFRVAQSNHKEGPYNIPSRTYPEDPYSGQVLSATYSSTSSILNIDTFSLSNEPQGLYSGWVETGMTLIGKTSGAQATITNVRLISDLSATLIGSFFIPNPNSSVHPRFEAGVKVLTFVNNELNDQNIATTISEESFISSGTLETVQENILSVRNARIEHKQEFEERAITRTSGSELINSRVISQTQRQGIIGWYDPIAQSFLVLDETGVFLTRCDVFFRSKDDMDIPVTIQLRTMQNGYPTQHVIPFSEVILEPDQVQISSDGSIATPISFKAPVYLEGGKEYCVCLASVSTKYSVYISRVGENDILTQTFISNQPYLGSFFKSQNASTWEASQWEDLKFSLYRADFIESGTVEFYSPELSEGNNQIAKLLPNSLNFNSKQIRIGLGSTINDLDFTIGNTVLQEGTSASGNYIGNAGIATGELNIINAGIGYTPSSGIETFFGVDLRSVTGNGRDATANITISNGIAISASIVNGGSGHQVGDVLEIVSIGLVNVGRNARFSLPAISNINEIILDNVQGDFISDLTNSIKYINNLGITTHLNGVGALVNNIIVQNDGLHVKVNHKNHGMYSDDNLVKIYNVQSDIKPTRLSSSLEIDSTGPISVDNSNNFEIFENVGVGTTNPGYILIGDEIIEYTSVSPGLIGGNITRGSTPKSYSVGTLVYKYELNGISLNRINKTHNLSDATIGNPISFDSYHIKLDTSVDGIDRSNSNNFSTLYPNQTKSTGGYNIRATQNMPFEIITPIVQNLTVQGTSLTGEIRTITGSSLSGTEASFSNVGFEPISINASNYLSSTRIIASKVNENEKLLNLPGQKSMNMRLRLSTSDTRLSPVIDTQRISTILTSNRIDSLIEDYKSDSRVDTIDEDPSAFQYISKEISLENSSSSIKIILDAHINLYSDIRAFYTISENRNFDPIFTPFPGYNNLDSRNQIIDVNENDGLPDLYNFPSNNLGFDSSEIDFREYTFTADQLPPFKSYRIKLIMTSTNQVYPPRIRNLRVIALA